MLLTEDLSFEVKRVYSGDAIFSQTGFNEAGIPVFVRVELISLSNRILLLTISVANIVFSLVRIRHVVKPALRYSYCGGDYFDNIGNGDYSEHLCYPVIDAVYTWVNGSDPMWLKEMLFYKKKWMESHPSQNAGEEDESSTPNRYRDNDELKWVL